MNKDLAKKIGKGAAFFAVFGITGAVALGVYKLYKLSKSLDDIEIDYSKYL